MEETPEPYAHLPPFMKGLTVARLMALMIPVALYFAAFSASQNVVPPHHPRAAPDPNQYAAGPVAVELFFLGLAGFFLSFYRRAELRDVVVQWSVPPGLLFLLWSEERYNDGKFFPVLQLSLALLTIISAIFWLLQQRIVGLRLPGMPWFFHALLAGFAQVGLLLLVPATCVCCIAVPLFLVEQIR